MATWQARHRPVFGGAQRCSAHRAAATCRLPVVSVRGEAASASAAVLDKKQPDWTGDKVLSRFVNWAISVPPLYAAMKVLAKQVLVSSAEQRGVRWSAHVAQLAANKELQAIKAEVEDPTLEHPSYYLMPFHAYAQGNLEWMAAYEVEPATYATGIRTFKDNKDWSPERCFEVLRGATTDAIKDYIARHGLRSPSAIIDMGCSSGMSTRWLAEQFPEAQVTGLDASPYFLALAEWRRRQAAAGSPASAIRYVHKVAERNGYEAGSQQMVAWNFVIHECPKAAILEFVQESKRLLAPNGVLCFVDNNPASKTIQNLPPAVFTLMKSTEPWSDEYYSFDLEAAMREAGFKEVITLETDHRHRTVLGIRP